MKCNVANGFCGAYAKHVDNRCNMFFSDGKDEYQVKTCPQRKRMNRLEKAYKNEPTLDGWGADLWNELQKEKKKSEK